MPRRRKSRRAKRGVHVSTKTGQVCKFRSGWEARYLSYLDGDPLIESYIYEPFAIPYVSNKRTGKVRRYYPDFLVKHFDGSIELVEIKPLRKTTKPTNLKKFAAARAWCQKNGTTFSIVTEIELKVRGLIT